MSEGITFLDKKKGNFLDLSYDNVNGLESAFNKLKGKRVTALINYSINYSGPFFGKNTNAFDTYSIKGKVEGVSKSESGIVNLILKSEVDKFKKIISEYHIPVNTKDVKVYSIIYEQ